MRLVATLVLFVLGASPVLADEPLTVLDPDAGGSTCKKVPPGKRIIKVQPTPRSAVADLVNWYAAIQCQPFKLHPKDLKGKNLDLPNGGPYTAEEFEDLFRKTLTKAGLEIQPDGRFWLIHPAPAKKR